MSRIWEIEDARAGYIRAEESAFAGFIESVAFFYIPDPLREPLCVKKKITWFKKRRHVYPLLSSGYISDAPRYI